MTGREGTAQPGHNRLMLRRWIFADQLGPHFLDAPGQPVLLVECKGVFRHRAFHRQKAHLILSALRHRAAELGDQAVFLRAETYRAALRRLGEPVQVCHPTSRRARELVRRIRQVEMLPARGFVTSGEDFVSWADEQRGTLRLEDFYQYARRRHRVLLDGTKPAGGRWSFEAQRRRPPGSASGRLDVPPPPSPTEDDIDAEVRRDLDRWAAEGIRFVGKDGPRQFPVTRAEAVARLDHFVRYRLPLFGAHQDAMLAADAYLAHSALSPAFNLGLLHPMEAIGKAERAYRRGRAPLPSVEAFIRQLLGWRDYVWHLYWYFDAGYRHGNPLPAAPRSIPRWFADLDAESLQARCLATALAGVRDRGWLPHPARLMVLGNYGLQRGWRPSELVDFFHRCFVDGHEWAMTANVAGMNPYADQGRTSSHPYAASGSHVNRVSDFCAACRYDPRTLLGDRACPFTAGYWAYLDAARERLRGNVRMSRALRQLDRFDDLPAVLAQETKRGSGAP